MGDAATSGHETPDDVPHPEARMTARTAWLAWAVLVAATLLGWLLASGSTLAEGGIGRMAGLVTIAGVKIYLVMAVFMGLWSAPLRWHLAAVAWIVAVGAAIMILAGGAVA